MHTLLSLKNVKATFLSSSHNTRLLVRGISTLSSVHLTGCAKEEDGIGTNNSPDCLIWPMRISDRGVMLLSIGAAVYWT